MKYYAEIAGFGTEALRFLTEPGSESLILFDKHVPPELSEIAVLQKQKVCSPTIAAGDMLVICGKVFTVTAVGSTALQSLRELGHCTLCFAGGSEAQRPGCIMVTGEEKLLPRDVQAGKTIEIY